MSVKLRFWSDSDQLDTRGQILWPQSLIFVGSTLSLIISITFTPLHFHHFLFLHCFYYTINSNSLLTSLHLSMLLFHQLILQSFSLLLKNQNDLSQNPTSWWLQSPSSNYYWQWRNWFCSSYQFVRLNNHCISVFFWFVFIWVDIGICLFCCGSSIHKFLWRSSNRSVSVCGSSQLSLSDCEVFKAAFS